MSDLDVQEVVRRAAIQLREAGATVEEVSVPLHSDGSLLKYRKTSKTFKNRKTIAYNNVYVIMGIICCCTHQQFCSNERFHYTLLI